VPTRLPDLSTRRRTGIEPARELVAPSTILKTAGPTRNPDASAAKPTCDVVLVRSCGSHENDVGEHLAFARVDELGILVALS
jgi:hypothetical protein